jgi:hypothetical protein
LFALGHTFLLALSTVVASVFFILVLRAGCTVLSASSNALSATRILSLKELSFIAAAGIYKATRFNVARPPFIVPKFTRPPDKFHPTAPVARKALRDANVLAKGAAASSRAAAVQILINLDFAQTTDVLAGRPFPRLAATPPPSSNHVDACYVMHATAVKVAEVASIAEHAAILVAALYLLQLRDLLNILPPGRG